MNLLFVYFLVALVMVFGLGFSLVIFGAVKQFVVAFKIGCAKIDALTSEIQKARNCFAPTHEVTCKSCGGLGTKVQDNPLIASIAKALDVDAQKKRR